MCWRFFHFVSLLVLKWIVLEQMLLLIRNHGCVVMGLRIHPYINKKAAVDDIALKIGLNVVPKKKKKTKNGNKRRKVKKEESNHHNNMPNKHNPAPPIIEWGESAKDFFWGSSNKRNPNIQLLENDQGFPLYRIQNVVSQRLQSLLLLHDNDYVELMEQHEMIGGKSRTLRRCLVARLPPHSSTNNNKKKKKKIQRDREIMDLILPGLPPELVEGIMDPTSSSHPYEDGSIVYYRRHYDDFYNVHHDSFAPGEPLRPKQRAYTILIYLRAPDCSGGGGTEFPRLSTPTTKSLLVQPREGDALIWPNFDQDGTPYLDSVHRALPLDTTSDATTMNDDDDLNSISGKDEFGKIVINLWFEGRIKKMLCLPPTPQ